MKNYNGTVVQTVHAIRRKAVGILAVLYCIVAVNQDVHGQCTPTPFSIKGTPTITGTAGAVGAKYRYTNALPNVDVEMQIDSILNGAALSNIDSIGNGTATMPTPTGYDNAWQPTINPTATPVGKDGYIRFKISFFTTGTNTPVFYNCLSLLAVDIDGNGDTARTNPTLPGSLREYVEALNPYSFAGQSTGAHLSYNAGSGLVRARASTNQVIPNTDSSKKYGMALFRFKSISSFSYTIGFSRSSTDGSPNRQFCLFFNVQSTFPNAFSRYYDTDGDGISDINNPNDLDDDNDGIVDMAEYPSGYPDPMLDADNDGLANFEDPTPGTTGFTWLDANSDGINDRYDADKDGTINSLDRDSDNDGITDLVEAGGVDTDGNGIVDYTGTWASVDTDNDGLIDRYDASVTNGVAIRNLDFDGDGIPNALDLDSDNDGIPDIVEAGGVDTNGDGRVDGFKDDDDDGLHDLFDGDLGDDGIPDNSGRAALILTGTYISASNPQPASYPQGIANDDGRNLPNFLDLDSDDDGISDVTEAGGIDANFDGKIDYTGTFASADVDGDGFLDSVDGEVNGTFYSTRPILATGADTNNDGRPDSYPNDNADGTFRPNPYDSDSDDDGIPDIIEAGGVDANGGGRVDADAMGNYVDANGNGWLDFYDPTVSGGINLRTLDINGSTTGGMVFDFDGDGIANYLDLDSDNDGIADIIEQGGTDANNDGKVDYTGTYAANDLDNDGFIDVYDPIDNRLPGSTPSGKTCLITAAGPVDATTKLPTIYSAGDNMDNVTLINMLDLDADDDGLLDTRESGISSGTGTSLDANNDGVVDASWTDGNGDGWADVVKGLPAFVLRNTDGIGQANYLDIDSDDDGIPDNVEAQATGSYILPATTVIGGITYSLDTDADGINDAYDNNDGLYAGAANNGLSLTDTDGDGTSDYRDLDSDNDGKSDRVEGWDTNGNGIIDGSEKAYSSPADADGDGLLDVYDAVVQSNATAYLNVNNNTTPTSYPDVNNPGGNRDWREVGTCSGNRLINPSFELPVQSGLFNHVFANGVNISGWRTGAGARVNLVRVDGSVYGAGPNSAHDGNQYLDIADAAGTMSQIFEVSCPSSFSFGGSFSYRNSPPNTADYNWTGKIEILTITGTVVATSTTRDFTTADADNDPTKDAVWYSVGGTTTVLPAGRYIFKASMGNAGNFDDAYVCVSGCFKPFNNDGDVITNMDDIDVDNDGITNTAESGGFDPYADADDDGIPNYTDATPGVEFYGAGKPAFVDANNDGINDFFDTDKDGIINAEDLDSDGDGIADLVEAGGIDANGDGTVDFTGTFASNDTNGDGLINTYDATTTGGVAIANLDTDGDGIPNAKDLDSDNDGIPDVVEAGGTDANNDGKLDNITDTDKDGLSDIVDGDVGNDGTAENTAGALIITSSTGTNGVPDNYLRANADGNGLPNPYDLDSDGDGILDTRESGLGMDTNSDGVINGSDTGFADTNGDGWADNVDALNILPLVNSDNDTKPNYLDIDSDNDGIPDIIEAQTTAGYLAPLGTDTDKDGIDDRYDNVNTAGTFGGNATNGLNPVDTDGDGIRDYRDSDSDNDGKPDRLEGWDTSGNGVINGTEKAYVGTTDTDGDGLLDEYDTVNGVATANNVTNNTTPGSYPDMNNPGGDRDWRQAQDTDKDGIIDTVDLDDDNDGIPDTVECPTCTTTVFQNGGFEQPAYANVDFHLTNTVPGWNTTEPDGQMEIWSNSYLGIAPYSGTQLLELNAVQAATVYQSFCLNGKGATILWTVRHKGRVGVDVASVGFGTSATSLTTVQTMTDGSNGWVTYSGVYNASAGITNLVMGLTALNSSSGNTNEGNLIDGVEITIVNQPCDTDGDGIPDSLDLDADGDGIPDLVEAGGIDANGDGTVDFTGTWASNDTDNDGLFDLYDPSETNPLVVGAAIRNLDTDGDGIPNAKDLDSDNDGIADVTEAGGVDANYDGKLDNMTDADNDGLSDLVDGDIGNTGSNVVTTRALILTSTGTLISGNPDSYPRANADANGLPNPYDLDADDDGIPDLIEVGGIDSNGDGRIDVATDANSNGWKDAYDPTNGGINLRTIDANGATAGGMVFDFDGDGIANYLDLDSDNDGIPDIIEQGGADTNNNGKADGTVDLDGDGFLDVYDPINGGVAGTPIITTGSTLNTFNYPSTYSAGDNQDGMGLINMLDLDADGDGITDVKEAGFAESGTTPGFAAGTIGSNGWSTTVSGSTTSTLALPNTDNRGPVNYLDIDSDDDGITDNVEGQATYSYKLPLGTDVDADGIDDAYDATSVVGGAGIVPVNTDNADVPDYVDLDSDNDNMPDLQEGYGSSSYTLPNTLDSDGDGLLNPFDEFDMSLLTSAMQAAMYSNVTMKYMGTNGISTANPALFGSNDLIKKTSTVSSADRDWRNIAIILPVKLISFTAAYSNKVANVSWTTANEDGHEHYLLERSVDGVSFSAVTSATAKGTATSNYAYADNAVPAASIVYYRLQMVNADGSISYSKVVAIRLSADKLNLSIYPNPVVDQVSISFASTTTQVVNVKVYNMQGAQVMAQVYKAQTGTNTLQLTNWSKLPAGDYLIEVSNDNFKLTHKLTHVH